MKLELKDVSKTFEKSVLQHLNFSDEMQTLALIGKSGCGKSTLLRILGGLIPADSGEAYLDEKKAEDSAGYRAGIGFVFQFGGLFSHISAVENITLPLIKVHHFSEEEARERAMDLLKRFGLEQEAGKLPSHLSGGQRQRIAIARAIAPRPGVLLLDEPTSALDPEYTAEVLSMIHELKEQGLSFVIATHEMGFALHSCEKVAFLSDGGIKEYAESREFFSHPKEEETRQFLSKLLKWSVSV